MRMNDTDLIEQPSSVDNNCVPIINSDESNENKLICDDNNILDTSIFKITFKDAETYSELNSLITRCVKNALFYLQKSVICTEDPSNFTVKFNETSKADDGLFIVDSAPSEMPEISNIIPEYSLSEVGINDKLDDHKKDESVNTTKTAQNTCFNCDGNHGLKDCLQPKDLNKIKQNRAKFSSNKLYYERYHVDVEQRFGHLVAGELSKDLRSALGLRSKELPNHIYRMRLLGYPPGWLEYAKVSSSGLTMFDSEGKEDDVNENEEDKYDLKKIITFPGFNVEPPHGTQDESRNYRAPPMQPSHSKEFLLESLRSKSTKAYKRRATQVVDATVLEPADMDIDDESDDDEQNMPLEDRVAKLYSTKETTKILENTASTSITVIPVESQSPLSDGEIVEIEPNRVISPTLDDLNERKKRLLVALDDSTVSMSNLEKKPIEDDSLIEDILALQDDSLLESSSINDENGDASINTTLTHSPSVTPQYNIIGKSPLHASKKTVSGTPVIKGLSPYNNLPSGEKWAAGVTDLLDFENLPESIGKYEKMRTLLGKVRAKVKKIQYDDEDK